MSRITIVKFNKPEYAKHDLWAVTVFSKSTVDAIAGVAGTAAKMLGKAGFFGKGKDAPEASVKEIARQAFDSGFAVKIHVKNLESQGMTVNVEEVDEQELKGVPIFRDEFGMEHASFVQGHWDNIFDWMKGKKKESDYI